MLSTSLAPLRERPVLPMCSASSLRPGKLSAWPCCKYLIEASMESSSIFFALQSTCNSCRAAARLGIRVSGLHENSTEVRQRAMECTPLCLKLPGHMAWKPNPIFISGRLRFLLYGCVSTAVDGLFLPRLCLLYSPFSSFFLSFFPPSLLSFLPPSTVSLF